MWNFPLVALVSSVPKFWSFECLGGWDPRPVQEREFRFLGHETQERKWEVEGSGADQCGGLFFRQGGEEPHEELLMGEQRGRRAERTGPGQRYRRETAEAEPTLTRQVAA